MAWNYGGDPANSDLDAVRLEIGDTDPTDQQLTDEVINYLLSEKGSVLVAAISACHYLASKYARKVEKTVGDIRVHLQDLQEHYERRADDLEDRLEEDTDLEAGGAGSVTADTFATEDRDAIFDIDMHERHSHE